MKKRISALILCICFAAAASGCGNTEDTDNRERNVQEERTGAGEDSGTAADESTADTSELQENAPQTSGNILVAYFSWADNAILADDVDAVASPSVIPPGNVQQLAGWVQEETGGARFPIQVTEPYSSDWDECLDRANQERRDDARPELEESVEIITEAAPDAEISDNIFDCYEEDASSSREEIQSWVSEVL